MIRVTILQMLWFKCALASEFVSLKMILMNFMVIIAIRVTML